jgi:hypothetical protein
MVRFPGGTRHKWYLIRWSTAAAGNSFSFPSLALIRMLFRKILAGQTAHALLLRLGYGGHVLAKGRVLL